MKRSGNECERSRFMMSSRNCAAGVACTAIRRDQRKTKKGGTIMSNTAVVNPVAAIGDCIVGLVAAATWVCQVTDEDRKAVNEYQDARKREQLKSRTMKAIRFDTFRKVWPDLKSASLHIKKPDTLILAAKNLGYHLEPLADAKKPLKQQTHIFLKKPTGERLAIGFKKDRRIVLISAGDDSRLHQLMQRHTMDRALDHLQKKGMSIKTATLSTGEVQILAREKTNEHRDGMAEIKAKVRNDGSVLIDVDRLQSNRCHEIVQEFAEAVGGQVTELKMKTACFKLPGEPAKTNIKV
jgi:hypothetical protein